MEAKMDSFPDRCTKAKVAFECDEERNRLEVLSTKSRSEELASARIRSGKSTDSATEVVLE
jgi:hypothetical protein